MKEIIQAHVQRDNSGYRAECFDLPVVAHAESLNEAIDKLHQAIKQYLNGKDHTLFGLVPEPKVLVSFHFGPFAFGDM